MLYLLLAIVCSSLIAIIFKFSEESNANRYAITVFNYIAAVVVSFSLLSSKTIFQISWFRSFMNEVPNVFIHAGRFSVQASQAYAVLLGSITGGFFFLGFWLYQYNVKKNGAVLSITFMKLGIIIPIVLSIFFFKEIPNKLQLSGIVLSILAIFLINNNKEGDLGKARWSLLLLFIIGGLGDFNSKVFQNFALTEYKDLFIFYIFLVALIISVFALLIKDRRLTLSYITLGLAVGIPNQLNSYFLIRALENIKASLVFPIFSSGTILVVNLANIFLLKEHMTKRQYTALGIIIVALIFLNA